MVSTRGTPTPKVASKKPKDTSKKKQESTFLEKGRYKDSDHINYKCNTQAFQKFWIHVKKELGTENSKLLIAELKQTPFWNLINAFDQNLLDDRKPDKLFGKLIKRFDRAKNRFRFGNRLYSITTVDVHNILGLKDDGAKLPLPYERYSKPKDNPLVQAFFMGVERLRRGHVADEINKIIQDKGNKDGECISNLSRLLILFLIATFLFASNGSTIPWIFVQSVESIEIMNKYNWAKGVKDYLHYFLANDIKKDQNDGRAARSISGCVLIIGYWICERSTLIVEKEGRSEMWPNFLKWNLDESRRILACLASMSRMDSLWLSNVPSILYDVFIEDGCFISRGFGYMSSPLYASLK